MKFTDKKGITSIKRACSVIEGNNVEYTLLSIGGIFRPVYAIQIKNFDECRMSFFGTDKKRAVSIFGSIVANTVTPCTLEDVAEDMANEM